MIDLKGYFCEACGTPVDLRNGRQLWSCAHEGGVIVAKLSGTLFKEDGSVADAGLPPAHRDAFRAQYGQHQFTGEGGEVRHSIKHWHAYIAAYHANPANGTRVGRVLAALGTIMQRLKLAAPRVHACEACGRGVTVHATGKIDRPCGHHDAPIVAKLSAGLTGSGGAAMTG